MISPSQKTPKQPPRFYAFLLKTLSIVFIYHLLQGILITSTPHTRLCIRDDTVASHNPATMTKTVKYLLWCMLIKIKITARLLDVQIVITVYNIEPTPSDLLINTAHFFVGYREMYPA